MQKDISPEERLLSIIKGKHTKADDTGAPKPEAKNNKAEIPAPKNKIDDYILAVLKNSFFKNSLFDPKILKVFNKYMVMLLALIALYIILDIILVSPSRKAASLISKVSSSSPLKPLTESGLPIETKNYSYYSSRIAGKNIFSGSSYGQPESQGEKESSDEISSGNLGLVGIIPGDKPQAIIEDKKNQKTYYLIKGQSINGITIEDINEGKAILEYRGKRMTLSL